MMLRNGLGLLVIVAAGSLTAACGSGKDTGTTAGGDAGWRDLNGNGQKEPYEDASLPVDQRIEDILGRMTLDQKVLMVSGAGSRRNALTAELDKVPGAAGYTVALENLGIPSIVLADGPAGLRIQPQREDDPGTYYATAFPIATLLASTWDVDLVQTVGAAMGNEVREYGVDIFLAPGMNIHRNPRGGRNFEYYSEDPYLSGHMAGAMINGVQSNGVGATPKHYVANNQETNRHSTDTIVSERALREIYLRGFQIAVEEADPWAIMSAYNLVNGTPASESEALLTKVLRDEWGFGGVVMTDWGAGSDAIAQMRAGNELLMPGAAEGTEKIRSAVEGGELAEAVLERNLRYILGVVLRSPSFQGYEFSNHPDLGAHAVTARQAAAEGAVLLKNEDHALPLQDGVKTIAAFGNTSYAFISGGTGSGDVNEAYTVSLVQALDARDFEIDEELQALYEAYIADEKAKLEPQENSFRYQPPPPEMAVTEDLAAEMAASSDLALITIGRNSGEGRDRPVDGDFYLTDVEQALIENVSSAFHAAGKKAIVILNIGNVIETVSWRDAPDAIIVPWQGGQEAGNAVLDVLVGDTNPSGRLPTSFPVDYTDVPSSGNFPGIPTGEPVMIRGMFEEQPSRVDYEEGIYVGYRYYDTFGVEPAYEFGYGLSYTTFDFGDVELSAKNFTDRLTASVKVTNTGEMAGREVVQLYLSAPHDGLGKPVRELKGFAKTGILAPGASETVQITLEGDDLASYYDDRSAWVADAGRYTVGIGSSSRDIRRTADFDLEHEIVVQEVVADLSPEAGISEITP